MAGRRGVSERECTRLSRRAIYSELAAIVMPRPVWSTLSTVIVDRNETTALARAGWGADGAGLWRFRAGAAAEEHLPIFPNGFVMYECGSRDQVLVNEAGGGRTWTIRRIDDIEHVTASGSWNGERWTLAGDLDAWDDAPRYVTVDRGDGHAGLVRLADGPATVDPLEWFWDGAYDHSWQGLGRPVEIPGDGRVIFPVQRDSRPVVYDPATRKVAHRLHLAGSHGNPSLQFLRTRPELWADDYDTMLRLRPDDWTVIDSRLLQDGQEQTAKFIGSYWMPHDEQLCFVARPFSGDVLVLSVESFATVEQLELGRQPLEAVRIGDELIARDWKSRDLSRLPLPLHLRRSR